MPTYYHGTISVFQESILKKDLLRTSGHPDGKRYVWLSPDINVAAEYAEMRTTCLAAPILCERRKASRFRRSICTGDRIRNRFAGLMEGGGAQPNHSGERRSTSVLQCSKVDEGKHRRRNAEMLLANSAISLLTGWCR
jgi:hypothetical protein